MAAFLSDISMSSLTRFFRVSGIRLTGEGVVELSSPKLVSSSKIKILCFLYKGALSVSDLNEGLDFRYLYY
jgi:hypothetical protein